MAVAGAETSPETPQQISGTLDDGPERRRRAHPSTLTGQSVSARNQRATTIAPNTIRDRRKLETVDARLRRAAIFDDLDPAAAKTLARRLGKVSFGHGHTVFSEGEPGETLYIITSGHVTITRRCPGGGAPRLTAVLGASEMFGELEVFDAGPRESSATALTDVKAVSLSRTAMRQWIAEHPAAVDTLLALLARRHRRTTAELCGLLQADLTARVARRLVDLAERFGTRDRDGIRVTPPLTHTDLAQLAGASRPLVHRVLDDFTEHGWIRMGDRGLLVVDAASLARRAERVVGRPP